jgi:hypothetical protein
MCASASVVMPGRNDGHGGDFLRRLRISLDTIDKLAGKTDTTTEVVLVEWNPPTDRSDLAEVLEPPTCEQCEVRVVTVSENHHERFPNSERTPLFQEIAKNVGVRRATGRSVLATNADIILNEEMMRFIGSSQVSPGAFYRASRHDVNAEIPLEASVDDIEFDSGNFRVAGTDKQKSIGEIAFTAYVPHNYPEGVEPGLDETAFYDPANFTYPAGVHIAEVEIDPETGTTRIVDWVAVDDFGKVINPMIVEGQVHGGIAQGVGQALLEEGVYDESGQLVTGSYQDYCMPRADDLPSYRVGMIETPCPHNPVGAKGCGEAGAIAAPPALMNAITDALGTEEISMPATREKVWRMARGRLAQAAE